MKTTTLDKFYQNVVISGYKTKQIAMWYALMYLSDKGEGEVVTTTTSLSALTGIAKQDIPNIFYELCDLSLVEGEVNGESVACVVADAEIKKSKPSNKFIPPTVDEVRAYCKEKGYRIDADNFVAFYSSKGWMVGKNHMKDWKAATRTWVRSSNQRNTGKVELG